MTWEVIIHPLVFQEDFKKVGHAAQKKIIKTIRKKLTADPKAFGRPLAGEFHGYWKLRVGEYRVVYTIEETRVLVKVVKVGIRRDFEIYEELVLRIPKILSF